MSLDAWLLHDEFSLDDVAHASYLEKAQDEDDYIAEGYSKTIRSAAEKAVESFTLPSYYTSPFSTEPCLYRDAPKNGDFVSQNQLLIKREDLQAWFGNRNIRPRFLFPSETTKAISALDPRKETTFHCLIAVLAKKAGYSPSNKDTVGKIHNLLSMEGVSMDSKTIRTNIKAAFDSLNEKRE